MTEGPRVNFVTREALYEMYTCILIFILYQNCPFLAKKYPFLIRIRAVFRTAAGTASSYVMGTVSWKNGCQNFSYVHCSRKYWMCKYTSEYDNFASQGSDPLMEGSGSESWLAKMRIRQAR